MMHQVTLDELLNSPILLFHKKAQGNFKGVLNSSFHQRHFGPFPCPSEAL